MPCCWFERWSGSRYEFSSMHYSSGLKPSAALQAAGHTAVTYDNLEAYKEILAVERRTLDEENFEEAAQQAFRVASPSEVSRPVFEVETITDLSQSRQIPDSIKALFASPQCTDISSSVS